MVRINKNDQQKTNNDTGANLGFEAKLWASADALRNNMDAAEYKHVVLGLNFLKYISDAFEARFSYLAEAVDDQFNPSEAYRAFPFLLDRQRLQSLYLSGYVCLLSDAVVELPILPLKQMFLRALSTEFSEIILTE